jgi:hypothetical protein
MPITINPRALDVDTIIDGARTALLANAAVTAVTSNIFSEIAPEGTTAPYVVLALASVVYESTYNGPKVNALLDVSCYTKPPGPNWSTASVRALMAACVSALIDTAWTIAGMTMMSADMEEAGTGFRQTSTVVSGVMTRGRQATVRVRALKN